MFTPILGLINYYTHTHIHTHTHIYIYIYIGVCVYVNIYTINQFRYIDQLETEGYITHD